MKKSKSVNQNLSRKLFQTGGYTPVQLSTSQFIPTYAGLPLAEAEKYGTELANIYNKNIADMTQLDILNANRKSTEGDTAISQQITGELQQQFEDIAKKGDYENMTARINELARRYYNDPRRKALDETYKAFEEEDKLAQQLRAKGIEPLFRGDRYSHQSINIDPQTGKIVPNVYRSEMEARLDYDPRRQDIWKVLQPDKSWSTSEARADLKTLPGYMTVEEIKGISGGINPKTGKPVGKVGQQFANALLRYMDTSEYEQEKKKLTKENINSGLSPEEAAVTADQEIQKSVLATGLMHVFQERDPNFVQDWILKEQIEGSEKSLLSPDLNTGIRNAVDDMYTRATEQFVPDASGSVLEAMRQRGDSPRYGGDPEDYSKYAKPPEERGTEQERKEYKTIARAALEAFNPEALKAINNIDDPGKATESENKLLFSKDTFEMIKQYQDMVAENMNFSQITSFDSTPKSQQLQKATTDNLQNFLGNKLFFDISAGSKGKVISAQGKGGKVNSEFTQIIEDPKYLQAVGYTTGVNPYGKLTGDPRFYNSLIVEYKNPDTGEFRQLLVADNKPNKDSALAGISELWSTGSMKPFQEVEATINNKNIKYKDIGQGIIKVYSIDGEKYHDAQGKEGLPISYNALYNQLFPQ